MDDNDYKYDELLSYLDMSIDAFHDIKDWMQRRYKSENLGGKALTTKQLRALKKLLKDKYNIDLVFEGANNIKRSFTPIGDFKTPKELFEFMRQNKKVGVFDSSTRQMLLPKKTTEIVVFHELAHVKHWHNLGDDAYKLVSKLDREMHVWEQIFKNISKWTQAEQKDALRYINDIRVEDYGLKQLNIKL